MYKNIVDIVGKCFTSFQKMKWNSFLYDQKTLYFISKLNSLLCSLIIHFNSSKLSCFFMFVRTFHVLWIDALCFCTHFFFLIYSLSLFLFQSFYSRILRMRLPIMMMKYDDHLKCYHGLVSLFWNAIKTVSPIYSKSPIACTY